MVLNFENFADGKVQTTDLFSWKRPFCPHRYNHFPMNNFKMFFFKFI